VGEELLKKDTAAVEKLKVELVEATLSLSSALNANIDLSQQGVRVEERGYYGGSLRAEEDGRDFESRE